MIQRKEDYNNFRGKPFSLSLFESWTPPETKTYQTLASRLEYHMFFGFQLPPVTATDLIRLDAGVFQSALLESRLKTFFLKYSSQYNLQQWHYNYNKLATKLKEEQNKWEKQQDILILKARRGGFRVYPHKGTPKSLLKAQQEMEDFLIINRFRK